MLSERVEKAVRSAGVRVKIVTSAFRPPLTGGGTLNGQSISTGISGGPLDRRGFFKGIACLGGAAAACAAGAPLAAPVGAAAFKAPPFKLSLAEWSFHRALFSGKLDHLDLVAKANDLGLDGVEYVNVFFKDRARDKLYLGEMKKRCRENGVPSLLIMIDDEGNLGDPDEKGRLRAVENHGRWLEAAAYLGCHSIRVNTESAPWEARSPTAFPEDATKLVADGVRRLCEIADPLGLNVVMENHGGISSNGRWLSKVVETVGHPRCGTLPDFGNFDLGGGKTYDRYRGVREMMPHARAVSAKSYDFDTQGNETRIDFRRMMKIVVDAGYHAHVGIEYEGDRLGEEEGVLKTRDLLLRIRGELSAV
jgi:L-ribulose-5-phosphate 3-epimerase